MLRKQKQNATVSLIFKACAVQQISSYNARILTNSNPIQNIFILFTLSYDMNRKLMNIESLDL